jgi:FOG: CBS domain
MDIEKMIINEQVTVLEAMEHLDRVATKILFVAEKGRLLAALTDGDIRRWILQKGDLNAPVKNAANYSPQYLVGATRQQALQHMRKQCIDAIPIVD